MSQSGTPIVNASALDMLAANSRRRAPKRYPLIGFGVLAVFVIGTLGTVAARSGVGFIVEAAKKKVDGPGSSPDVKSLAPSVRLAFVQAGQDARQLSCLSAFRPDQGVHPNEPCALGARESIQRLDGGVASVIGPLSDGKLPRALKKLRDQIVALDDAVRPLITVLEHGSGPDLATTTKLNRVGQNAEQVAANAAVYFDLDESAAKPPDPSATIPESDGRRSGAGSLREPANTAADVPVSTVDVPPELSGGTLGLAASAALGAQESRERLVGGEPALVGSTDAMPSSTPRNPAVASLLTGVKDVLRSLKAAGHDSTKIADATWQGRTVLDKVDQQLRSYRELPRDEDAQARALSFSRQIDQARGHLLQATAEMQQTTMTPDPMPGRSFRKSDGLLDKVVADLRVADTQALTAP
jgi:hypothetical protein